MPGSLNPPRLHWEQAALVALLAVLLAAGLGWGLPGQGRSQLLTWGMDQSPEQIKSQFSRLEPAAGRETPRQRELLLTPWHKYQNFCDYILYSAAVDEWLAYGLLAQMNPAAGDFRPRSHIYGGAFIYPLGAAIFAGRALGLFQTVADSSFYLRHPEHMARMQMTGRALVAASYLGVLLLLGLWGNRLGGRAAGTLAMLAWAFSSLPFVQALVSKPHVYAAFWGLGGLYLLWLHAQDHAEGARPLRLLGSMLCLGLAAGSNIFAWSLALAYPLLLFRPGRPWPWLRPCLWGWAGMAMVYLLSNPYVLLDYSSLLADIRRHGAGGWDYAGFNLPKLGRYLTSLLQRTYAFPLGLAGGVFLLASLWRDQSHGQGLVRRLALLEAALLVILGATVGVERITLFVGPVLCLLAGLGLAQWFWQGAWAPVAVRRAALGALLLPGLATLALHARDVASPGAWQKPTLAWLEEVKPGPAATLGVLGSSLTPNHLPPLPFLNLGVMNLLLWQPGDPEPDYVLLDNYQRQGDLERWRAHPLFPRYRLERDLGWRDSYAWLAAIRFPSEARIAAWVYVRLDP
jgi:hypothetical protein